MKVSLAFLILILVLLSCNNTNNLDNKNVTQLEVPNIIFIYADNLGYGDVGCFGSQIHRTPNIDKMVEEGIKLTSLYSSSPVCTPSRASLMTGCYAQRVDMHLDDKNGHVIRPISSKGLNPEEITIAEILKNRGYATACIGKWHLGDQPEFLPVNQGFDYFFGIPYSEDMVPSHSPEWPDLPLVKNDKVIEAPVDLTTTTRRYVREAIRFITENKNKPFFLYFPENLPGSRKTPIVDDLFRGKSVNGAWGDAVEEIDWSVGEIMKTLKELGLEEKTIIVFTSDNGAPHGSSSSGRGSNEPFSGPGYSTMEGGMRVPCIVKWSGRIPAGRSNNELCTMMDWLPTFAEIAGAKVPEDRIIDGRDIWTLLLDDVGAKTPHEVFYYYYTNDLQAVREGKWKLYLTSDYKTDALNEDNSLKLIDLSRDIKEITDLSVEFPEVVERLKLRAEQMAVELGNGSSRGKMIRPAGYVENPKALIMK